MTLRSRGRHGRINKSIRITTNDPRNPKTTLTCEGVIRGAFKGPAPRARFGKIDRDSGPQTKTLAIRRGDGGPITPEIGPIKGGNVTTALREITAGEHYELDVTVSPPWPNRRITTSFNVKTGVAKAPEEAVIVTADVTPRVRTVPNRFTIPQVTSKAKEVAVQVVWDRNAPQRIVKAEVSDRRLSVRIEDEGERQKVVLGVPAGYDGSPRSPQVTLTTDDQHIQVFSVPVRYERPGKSLPAKTASRRVRPTTPSRPGGDAALTTARTKPQTAKAQEATSAQGSEKASTAKKVHKFKAIQKTRKPASSPKDQKAGEKKMENKDKKDTDQ